MSRIRSIHPGLWTDEAFVSLSPFARLFIVGLWNECDDLGSFAWTPLGLKMRLLPADMIDAASLLDEGVQAGILMRYEMGGKTYGAVRNFCQYQRPKKPNSVHPQTDEVRDWVNLAAREKRDGGEAAPNQLPTEPEKARQMEDGGGDKEGKSDDLPKARKRASNVNFEIPDWVPDEPWAEFVAMRKAMRNAPFTVGAAKGIVGDLERLKAEGHDPGKVLLRSVKLSYRGVFGHDETKGIVGSGTDWTPERQKAFLASLEPDKPPDDGRVAGNVLGLVRKVGGR